MKKIPLGISQCLLGDAVRYDGGHKRSDYLLELQDVFAYHAVCPELSIGLGAPRDPIRLIAAGGHTHARIHATSVDVTDALAGQADFVATTLPDLCGYVFMEKSPSCGLFSVKRFSECGALMEKDARGIYAAQLTKLMPLLPAEEAGRLTDRHVRENFLIRVAALSDWKKMVAAEPSAHALKHYYRRYRFQVMAHHLPAYFALAHLVASCSPHNVSMVCAQFLPRMMAALQHPVSRLGNAQVMMHLRDRIQSRLNRTEKTSLSRAIEAYLNKNLPLETPLVMLKRVLVEPARDDGDSFWANYEQRIGLNTFIFAGLASQPEAN